MKTIPRLALASSLIFLIQNSLAESLPEIIVSATRTAQTVNDTLSSVTVFTAEDIQQQHASSLQELLQARAGFQLVNNGGAGKITSLFLRGTESDHILMMIDGIKINSSSTGTPPLELIPLEMIERVEIVRGPRASLYGPDAIGGVIQIFTKKGHAGDTIKPTLSLTTGSHNTQGVTAGVLGGAGNASYSFTLKKEKTDGYNACTGSSTAFAGCFTEEPDKDAYDNQSISVNLGYQFNNTRLSGQFLGSDNNIEFDGAAPFASNESQSLLQSYGITLSSELTDHSNFLLSVGRSANKNKNLQSGVFFSRFNTERDSLSLQGNIDITEDHLLTVGVDYLEDEARTTSYGKVSRDNIGLFAEYQADIHNHNVNIGLRKDDNQQFGNKTTGNIAIGHLINQNMKFITSYATAFKAPTFNELFFPFFGNTELSPEESYTIEIGLRGKQDWGTWSGSLYRTKIDNLIVYDANAMLANNIDKAKIKGVEFIAETRIQAWQFNANLTLLDTEDQSKGFNNGNELARRPRKSLHLNIDREFPRFSIGSTLVSESERFDDSGNNRRIGGYATTTLRASYKLMKGLSIRAKVGNLFDKHYETTSFYPQDGRNFRLTLQYAP
ncbi:MAG: TonB-dependent receptor [Gammaproteobacteria bacterium]